MKLHLKLLLVWLMATGNANASSTIDETNRFAYAANAGWVDARVDSTNGAVIGRFFCFGHLYGANVGWIGLGAGAPANGRAYGNSTAADYGVNHDGAGNLRGMAWGANIGWISFEATGSPRVDLRTGNLSGYIYGANIGWITLNNAHAFVRTKRLDAGPDSDNDSLPDGWEYGFTNSLPVLSGLGAADADGDGISDAQEFVADTDPLSNQEFLSVVALNVKGITNRVTWSSRATRIYRLELTTNLAAPSWNDSGLGLVDPDTGAATSREITTTNSIQFYKVKAKVPLWP